MSDRTQDCGATILFWFGLRKIMTLHWAPGVICVRSKELPCRKFVGYREKKGWIQNSGEITTLLSLPSSGLSSKNITTTPVFSVLSFAFRRPSDFLSIMSANNDCILSEAMMAWSGARGRCSHFISANSQVRFSCRKFWDLIPRTRRNRGTNTRFIEGIQPVFTALDQSCKGLVLRTQWDTLLLEVYQSVCGNLSS